MENTNKPLVKTGDENPVNRTSELKEEKSDYEKITSQLPSSWDMDSEWGSKLIGKVRDLIIDEANKIKMKEAYN